MYPLLDWMVDKIPGPDVEPDEIFTTVGHQSRLVRVCWKNRDWPTYIGKIRRNQQIDIIKEDSIVAAQVASLQSFDKLGRVEAEEAVAGDIVAVIGLDEVEIGDTIANEESIVRLPRLRVDEPTLEMVFFRSTVHLWRVGDGKYVTTRQLRSRLEKELERNVALRVRPVPGSEPSQLLAEVFCTYLY